MKTDYLILSDLHLAEGRDPETQRISRMENFFADEPFDRMLLHLQGLAEQRGKSWIFILNGDFMDFLRVTSIPDPRSLAPGFPVISPTKQKYGLGTSPAESKWQLERIVAGHPVFFRALSRFILAGHRLIILKGNHDVNWFWPEVRYRFLELMEDHLKRLSSHPERGEDGISSALDRIEIRPWIYYAEDLLYVEHGSQYDPVNAFRNYLYPLLLDPDCPVDRYEIDLPFGSFFIRYFFNKIESQDPTAPNYIHPSSYFSTLWGRHFFAVWNVVRNYFPYFFRTLRKIGTRRNGRYGEIQSHHQRLVQKIGEEYGEKEAIEAIAKLHESPIHSSKRDFLAHLLQRPLKKFAIALGGLLILSFLWSFLSEGILGSSMSLLMRTTISLILNYGFIVAGLVWLLFFLKPSKHGISYREAEPEVLREAAARITRILNVKYITFGHSHLEDIWKVPGRNAWYFNTGTWTPVFDAENRVLRPHLHLPALIVENGRARLVRWNDAAREFEDLPILTDRSPA